MEASAGLVGIFWIIVICFAVGSFLALPYIWYHTGQASKKLSDLIHLQRETNVRLTKILDSLPNKNEQK